MLGLAPAQNFTNAIIDRRIGAVILSIHLKIDIQRSPAGAKVGLPLQLHLPAGDRQRPLTSVLIVKSDRAIPGVHLFHRHIQHTAGFRVDRQETGIALLTLLAQAFEHHGHDGVIPLAGAQQHLIKTAVLVKFGGADELILEPERVQKPAQHGVVVVTEALMLAKRIGHRGQRTLQILAQHLRVRNIVRNLAHPVHVIRKADQARWDVANLLKRAADHRRARDLAKSANMRQAGGTIAGFEQNMTLFRRRLFIAFEKPARLFKGPGLGGHRSITRNGHVVLFLEGRATAQPV